MAALTFRDYTIASQQLSDLAYCESTIKNGAEAITLARKKSHGECRKALTVAVKKHTIRITDPPEGGI